MWEGARRQEEGVGLWRGLHLPPFLSSGSRGHADADGVLAVSNRYRIYLEPKLPGGVAVSRTLETEAATLSFCCRHAAV